MIVVGALFLYFYFYFFLFPVHFPLIVIFNQLPVHAVKQKEQNA